MAKDKILREEYVDSAVGPLRVVRKHIARFDVDSYARMSVESQATRMQLMHLINNVDPSFAKGRAQITSGGVTAGGNDAN